MPQVVDVVEIQELKTLLVSFARYGGTLLFVFVEKKSPKSLVELTHLPLGAWMEVDISPRNP
jgi:hypothetical protein